MTFACKVNLLSVNMLLNDFDKHLLGKMKFLYGLCSLILVLHTKDRIRVLS